MKASITSVVSMAFLCAIAGCGGEQASKTGPYADLKGEVSSLSEKLAYSELKRERLDAQVEGIGKHLEAIDTKLTALSGRLDKVAEIPESLSAESAANRAYVKAVSNDLGSLRDKTVEVLDLQNRRLVEGRKAYIAVLRSEANLLTEKLKEMSTAISTLEQGLPDAEKEISSVLVSPKKQP